MLKRILMAGLKTGGVLSVTVILAIMASSKRDSGNGWNAVNSICHVVDGDDVSQPSGFQPRDSLLGIATNSSAMVFWGASKRATLARMLSVTSYDPAWPATVIHECALREIVADESAVGPLSLTSAEKLE